MPLSLIRMGAEEFPDYIEFITQNYAEQSGEAYGWQHETALGYSKRTLEEDLPKGYKTENNYFYNISKGQKVVGALWFSINDTEEEKVLFLLYINVKEEHKNNGYAFEAFKLLQDKAKREFGVSDIRLAAYAHNKNAIKLYEKIGFETLTVRMGLKID